MELKLLIMELVHLEKIIELEKEYCTYINLPGPAYNSLLDGYEEGMTVDKLKNEFNVLKSELTSILEKVTSSQRKDRILYLIKEENKYFYEKTKDERRFLRQSQFSKIFEKFRKMSIPLNDIKFIKNDYDKEKETIIEREININDLVNLPYHYVIIALCNENSELIEIGLLFTINVEKDYILLFSDLTYKQQINVKKILLGSLRLSTKGNHQGYLYL